MAHGDQECNEYFHEFQNIFCACADADESGLIMVIIRACLAGLKPIQNPMGKLEK
jgi:hypothetical protein